MTYRIVEAFGVYLVQSNPNPAATGLWLTLVSFREERCAEIALNFYVDKERARLAADKGEGRIVREVVC